MSARAHRPQDGVERLTQRGVEGRARDAHRAMRIARAVLSAPILAYVKVISPALPRRCRYEPTCSAYALEAVRGYGVWKGLVLAAWRLLRCNPFSDGGLDPVGDQRLFGAKAARDERARAKAAR
ncbi:MAG: membrane protein insertion efficiency factor YidD [Solirubrobacteraceae bacterium]